MKLLIIGFVLSLFLLVGCDKDDTGEMEQITICKQVCSNQDLWDNRGSMPFFECEMYHTKQGIIRDCKALDMEMDEDFKITRKELNTTCLEVCSIIEPPIVSVTEVEEIPLCYLTNNFALCFETPYDKEMALSLLDENWIEVIDCCDGDNCNWTCIKELRGY